jgi:hypothetical protein
VYVLFFFAKADDLGIDPFVLEVVHQFLRERVITDHDDLFYKVFFSFEVLGDDEIEEAVGQQQDGDAAHDRYDKGSGDRYLVKKVEIEHREPDEIQKSVHRPPGEQFEVYDVFPVIDAGDPGDDDPADVQEIQKGIVFDDGGDDESFPEKVFAEKEDDVDNNQVQNYQGDLEVI